MDDGLRGYPRVQTPWKDHIKMLLVHKDVIKKSKWTSSTHDMTEQ